MLLGYARRLARAPGRARHRPEDRSVRDPATATAQTSGALRFAARESYDKYLKANRVERGIESYDAVVQLILGTEVDRAGNPRLR